MHAKKPKVFISHAWTNKPLVRQLENELRAAGAEVWVDHKGIRGGDNLPEEISNALEWCNTLILIWSESASRSQWVKLEWTSAVSLKKRLIPCRVDRTKLPAILAHKAYIDLLDIGQGFAQLKRSLSLTNEEPDELPSGEPDIIGIQEDTNQQVQHGLSLSSTQEKLMAILSDEALPRGEISRRLVSIFGSETRPAQASRQLEDLIQRRLISERKSENAETLFELTQEGHQRVSTSERVVDITVSNPNEKSVKKDPTNPTMFFFPCPLSATPFAEWIEIFNEEWARRDFPYFREATVQNSAIVLRCPAEEFQNRSEHLVFDVNTANRKYRELLKKQAQRKESSKRQAEEQNVRDQDAIRRALKE